MSQEPLTLTKGRRNQLTHRRPIHLPTIASNSRMHRLLRTGQNPDAGVSGRNVHPVPPKSKEGRPRAISHHATCDITHDSYVAAIQVSQNHWCHATRYVYTTQHCDIARNSECHVHATRAADDWWLRTSENWATTLMSQLCSNPNLMT